MWSSSALSLGRTRPRTASTPHLNKSPFRERHTGGAAYDEMVENLHVDQSQCVLERLSQRFVRAARLSDTGRMVVGEDDCCGVEAQRQLDDLAGEYAGLRERAAEDALS